MPLEATHHGVSDLPGLGVPQPPCPRGPVPQSAPVEVERHPIHPLSPPRIGPHEAPHGEDVVAACGGDVVGVDWRMPLDVAWEKIGFDRAVQGNLDPVALLSPWPELKIRVDDVLERANGRVGHIFNLGHGIHQFHDQSRGSPKHGRPQYCEFTERCRA